MSTPKRFHRVRAVLDRRQPDLTVLMEDVQIPRNLAALLRTCDAVGVLEAHAVWRERGQLKISRPASGGTRKWVQVRRHKDLDGAVGQLKERGFRILAAHPADRAVDYREVDYTLPTAVLLGQEETGVTPRAEIDDLERAKAILVWAGSHHEDLHGPLRRGDSAVHPLAARITGLVAVFGCGLGLAVAVGIAAG